MTSNPKHNIPQYLIVVSVAVTVIFIAAYMMWGKVPVSLNMFSTQPQVMTPGQGNIIVPAAPEPVNSQIIVTMTGWNGSFSLGKLELPNWLTTMSAMVVATLCWLKQLGIWDASPVIFIGLTVYGFLYSGLFIHFVASANAGIIGVGSLLTFFSFLVMLVMLLKQFGRQKLF